MRAIIPVAGVGTRLRPHTYTLPKVLLNVGGKPILGHILDSIIEQGIEKATIVTGYMGKLVEEYVKSRYNIDIEFIPQKSSLGLGHAIWVAKETFNDDPLLIILGDTVFDFNLKLMTQQNNSTIGVKKVDDPRRFGVVIENENNEICELIEKPEKFVSDLAIVGLYYISNPKLLAESLDELINNNIKTRDEYQLTDALQLMLKKGEKFTSFPIEGWYDCGKPETLLDTNRYLLNKFPLTQDLEDAVIIPPVYIAPNAVVKKSVIGPYATVASGAVVTDSVVRNSIISDEATVESSLLEDSIIGNNAIVKGHFYKLNVGNSSEIDY